MTENSELLRKLTALSTPTTVLEDGTRVISNGIWPLPVPIILSEIDDTVLKRKLTFQNGSSHLSVVASGRRLLAVVEVSENLATPPEILGQALSSTQTDLTTSVAGLLAEFARQEGRLLVKSDATELLDSQTGGGVPVSMLADALGIDFDDTTEGPLEKFLEVTEGLLSACIFYANGKEIGTTGDVSDISVVRSAIDTDWHALRNKLPFLQREDHHPFLICLAGAVGSAGSLFVAESGESRAAFTATNDDVPAIQASWGDYFVI